MRVFKYRAGKALKQEDRDIDSLVDDVFWAPTREKLNDPYEGLFHKEMFETQLDHLERILNDGQGLFDELRDSLAEVLSFVDKSGIYSLSTEFDDELLWAHYADSHNGFCIEYDLEKLLEFTQIPNHIVHVEYSNSPPHIELSDIVDISNSNEYLLQKMLGTKSKRWKFEQEVRIVTSLSGRHSYDYRAVKAIYFGLNMKSDRQEEIMKRLSGRGITYYKIKIGVDYSFSHEPITAPHAEAQEYKYEISPVLNSAILPDLVNDKYRAYVGYLDKAAEIVRRDPYCDEVEFVEFSPEKSTIENPVLLVMCKKCQNRWPRYYLTLEEVDEQYSKLKDLVEKENTTL